MRSFCEGSQMALRVRARMPLLTAVTALKRTGEFLRCAADALGKGLC